MMVFEVATLLSDAHVSGSLRYWLGVEAVLVEREAAPASRRRRRMPRRRARRSDGSVDAAASVAVARGHVREESLNRQTLEVVRP